MKAAVVVGFWVCDLEIERESERNTEREIERERVKKINSV